MTKQCASCRYRGSVSSSRGTTGPCCDYCFLTGHSRLLLPPREDGTCPAYEEGERARVIVAPTLVSYKTPVRHRPMKFSHEALLSLYAQGLNDSQIAKEIRAVPSTVRKWRHRNGLPTNYRPGGAGGGGKTPHPSAAPTPSPQGEGK